MGFFILNSIYRSSTDSYFPPNVLAVDQNESNAMLLTLQKLNQSGPDFIKICILY